MTKESKNTEDGEESTQDGSGEKISPQKEPGQPPGTKKKSQRPDSDSLSFEEILKKISEHQGNYSEFRQFLTDLLNKYLERICGIKPFSKYYVTFLWTDYPLFEIHLNQIHSHLRKLKHDSENEQGKDILMIINNPGGAIEPAFQISKLCNNYKKSKFVVVIPRRAKSAATLVSIGANEIHMGDLSELGPIDPQLPNGTPAIGVNDALISLAKIVTEYPGSAPLFSEFISQKMTLDILGWLTRIPLSASQYAQKLLSINHNKEGIESKEEEIKKVAAILVETYKDHGFVIDSQEAKNIFKDTISEDLIKVNSPEIKNSREVTRRVILFRVCNK